MTDQRVAFICDRKKCKNCNPDCLHTTDINHAANFELTLAPDTWFERKPTVDAIPFEWIEEWCISQDLTYIEIAVGKLLDDWREENDKNKTD